MIWIEASLAGAAIALAYCASLWFAVGRAAGSTHSLAWYGLTSLARIALVGAAFYALALLGPEVALCALIGFGVARSGVVYWLGRPV